MKTRLGALLVFCGLVATLGFIRAPSAAHSGNPDPIAAQFEETSLFLSPIRQATNDPAGGAVTGITVPHHLLARDLIAQAFRYASGGAYDLIVVLSPDHFSLGDSNVSTTTRDFSTVFGLLRSDEDAVRELKQLPFVHEQSFFYREHGVQAELPFIAYHFPSAKVVVLTFKETTPREQLDRVVEGLKGILTPHSLVVQSTDFSHYLTPDDAQAHDRQTIAVLERNEPEELFTLDQPSNMDSIAAQYVQSRLQKEFFASTYTLLAHKNSQDYTTERVDSSTSYIVQAYLRKAR